MQNGLLTGTDVTSDLRGVKVVVSEVNPTMLLDAAEGMQLSDLVLLRVVQAVQESFMTGTDFTDHMRMMRLEKNDDDCMTLTRDYMDMVKRNLEAQVEDGKRLVDERSSAYSEDESHIVRGDE